MSNRVRVAFDIDVNKGDPEEVKNVLFEHRDKLMGYAIDVVLPNDDRTDEVKAKMVGGNTHVHPNDREDLPCDECKRYSGRTRLAVVE